MLFLTLMLYKDKEDNVKKNLFSDTWFFCGYMLDVINFSEFPTIIMIEKLQFIFIVERYHQ